MNPSVIMRAAIIVRVLRNIQPSTSTNAERNELSVPVENDAINSLNSFHKCNRPGMSKIRGTAHQVLAKFPLKTRENDP